MDVNNASHAAKLEPFLLMSKSLKGAALSKLVTDATSAPGVFVFGELLEQANVQALDEKALGLLKLFAYGTYSDHKPELFGELNAAQTHKLRQLTVLSMASSSRIIPYSTLLSALNLSSIRELEDLIITSIYASLLTAKLDQKHNTVEVEYVMGRDVSPDSLPHLLAALKSWAENTQKVLENIDRVTVEVTRAEKAKKQKAEDGERVVQATLKEIQEKSKHKEESKGVSGLISGLRRNRDEEKPQRKRRAL